MSVSLDIGRVMGLAIGVAIRTRTDVIDAFFVLFL